MGLAVALLVAKLAWAFLVLRLLASVMAVVA